MVMRKVLHTRDDIDSVCLEKEEEEDSEPLKIAWIQQSKERLIKTVNYSSDHITRSRKQKGEEKHLCGYFK